MSSSPGPAVGGGSAVDGDTLAERIARAVLRAPSVTGLHGGRWGTAGTYLPRRQVIGVIVDERAVTVHVVGVYGSAMGQISADVRRELVSVAGERVVDVVVEDLDTAARTVSTALHRGRCRRHSRIL